MSPKSDLITVSQPGIIPFIGATHPLKTETLNIDMPEGLTVLDMLKAAQPDPILLCDAVVFIDDVEIKRDYWHVVRPKAGHTVTARVVPYLRGGGGGGKNPLRTLLTIAVIAASFYLGPAVGLALGFEGATASIVGGIIVSVAGNLLVNAIAPIRQPQLGTTINSPAESPSLFLSGARNTARPFEVVPTVLGFYRIRPPLGAKTFTEVLGDKSRLRMLMVVGFGELELSDFEIGNTSIGEFEDFEIETRLGTASDLPITLYTDITEQEGFSIALTQVSDFHQRTSDLNADELSIDITFPRGLVAFDTSGNRGSRTVVIEVQFRKVGDVTWLDIPAGFSATFATANVSGAEVTFTGAQSTSIYHGISWKTGERAQYEIRVRRTTSDTTSTQIFDLAFWATLRTITNEDPIQFPLPLAKIALSIRSSDQLNGLLDTFSVFVKSVVLDWDSGGQIWVKRASNNPASLFRHVLQGPAKVEPLTDDEIDLEKLQEWHEFCALKGFTFNMVRDFKSSMMDVLADIASAGRAGLDLVDGKWSVIIDQPVADITTHITPRNSSGFELEKSFAQLPHAWRIRFPNENERYEHDERIVYQDGFDETNATLFNSLEFPGVTNPDHIYLQGRYHGAVAVNRAERWTVTQDFESLIARRGSRVKITHDVLLVGLGSGRIKSLTTNGGGDVLTITVDEGLEMETGKSYGLVIRRAIAGDVSLSVPIDTVDGVSHTVTVTTPILMVDAPFDGDLFGFGELGQETEDALVVLNTPQTEFVGSVALVPYRESIYDADAGSIPPYVPNITEDVFLPAAIINEVVTDESVLVLGSNDTVSVSAEVRVIPINETGVFLEIQQRFTGTSESFYNSDVISKNSSSIRVSSVQTGDTIDFRVRWNDLNRLPGPWTEVSGVFVVGKSSDPEPLLNPTLSVFGGQVFIRWDEPSELDVSFGGTVQFRHTQDTGPPIPWSDTTSIGQAAQARSLFMSLPSKPGTYLARVIDSTGNQSSIVYLEAKQADLLEFANVDTLDEGPTFVGIHNNTVGTSNELKLDSEGLVDDITDVDSVADWDSEGGIELSGTYSFAAGFDLVTVKSVRLTTRVTAQSVNILFSEPDQAEADLQVWVRHTDDDPGGSPTWSEFTRLDSAVFEARGFDFEARLSTNSSSYNIICTELGVDAEEIA